MRKQNLRRTGFKKDLQAKSIIWIYKKRNCPGQELGSRWRGRHPKSSSWDQREVENLRWGLRLLTLHEIQSWWCSLWENWSKQPPRMRCLRRRETWSMVSEQLGHMRMHAFTISRYVILIWNSNHNKTLSMMKAKKGIGRPDITRITTAFLTLQSLYEKRKLRLCSLLMS